MPALGWQRLAQRERYPDAPDYRSVRYAYRRRLDRFQLRAILDGVAIERDARLLEVGCATGELLAELGRLGLRTVGVDINEHSVQRVGTGVVAAGDALRLPFPDECFSLVISAHVIEHVESVQDFLSEATRVLAPGGQLFLAFPAEPVRGLFAMWSSLKLYYDPFKARRIHLHRLTPMKLAASMAPNSPLRAQKALFCLAPLPQFFTVFSKQPAALQAAPMGSARDETGMAAVVR